MMLRSGRASTLFIAPTLGRAYLGRTMLRIFACLAAALALFFSPIVMSGGAGMAAAHAPGAASAMVEGHCSGNEAPADDQQQDFSGGCASSCAAVAPAPSRLGGQAGVSRTPPPLLSHQLLAGIDPEGETPPPRITPEI
jgi:hypothetical protein